MVRTVAVVLAIAAACAGAPAVAELAAPAPPERSAYVRSVLTDDGPGLHVRKASGGRVVVRGERSDVRHRDRNSREVFRRPGAPMAGPQTTCATWIRQSDQSVQQGLAVRIRDRAGRVRAVTLTKNVEFGLYWIFNVLTWDTARSGEPWRKVGQFDLAPVVGKSAHRLAPLPWRVCLRATGRTVEFKVWLPEEGAEPSWQDPVHARSARLPRGYAVGRPGWYVGHLPAGGRVVYGGLTTSP
jgi:hypothetical protein